MYRLLASGTILGLFLQVVPITCLVGIVYAVIRYRHIKKRGHAIAWGTEIVRCLFVCYLTGLINLVLVPQNLWLAIWFYVFNGYGSGCDMGHFLTANFNFVPSIYRWWKGELELGQWVKTMLAVNALMYVPMGLFLPLVFQKINGRNIVPVAIAIPVVIELIQPVIGRSFDMDDVLTNFIGIIAGYLVGAVLRAALKKRNKGDRESDPILS